MTDSIDEQAYTLLERFSVPVRRARPRVAEMLRDADHAMIDTPAGSIATWRLGQGPAILLVHGWEDDNAIWSPLIERLFFAGRSVLVIDLPAHGHSTGESCGLPQSSAAICTVAQALGPIEAVITHSYGGPSTGLALEQGLQADTVIMIAAPLALPGQVDKMVERYGISPKVATRFQELLPSVLGQPVEWFDLARLAPSMTARALFVHSVDDDSCPYQNSSRLADLWPNGELLLTDGLGHRIVAQDADIHARILDFLDGH